MKINELLIESVFQLDNVVNYIFDKYFKDTIDELHADVPVYPLKKVTFSSTELPRNKHVSAANKVNPVTISINAGKGNVYYPKRREIGLSVNENAYEFVRRYASLSDAVAALKKSGQPHKAISLVNEFTPARIKGSIHHELVHWLDDTLRNFHIKRLYKKSSDTDLYKRSSVIQQKKPDVALTNYEREAQIHSIIQLKKAYGRQWNRLSFEEMIRLNPSLEKIYDEAEEDGWLEQWKQLILRRMHREGLLGKSMVKS